MQIGRKIYYELSTGNVIQDTGEREGSVVETTTEQDFAIYLPLVGLDASTVGCLELDYGTNTDKFLNCTSFKVNTETNTIEFTMPE